MERFLQGMHAMDTHYRSAPLADNLPALLGLLNVSRQLFMRFLFRLCVRTSAWSAMSSAAGRMDGRPFRQCTAAHRLPALNTPPRLPPQVWNSTFLGHATTALLPYQQALQHFAPHIQQLSMESNGKGVALDGTPLPFETGAAEGAFPLRVLLRLLCDAARLQSAVSQG